MGPSGAGKSTLLHILGLHDSDFTGEYHLVGEPVHKLGASSATSCRSARSGSCSRATTCSTSSRCPRTWSCRSRYRNVKKSEREAIVADTLDRFQIVGKKDLYPRQLSGGQQQLVAVARAIVASPKLILADEPTGNLHSEQGAEIMQLFQKLNAEGTTIIQVTHSETNAGYGRRVVRMRDGWIVND